MNILTFDIEEWYLEKTLYGGHAEKYALYDDYLSKILDLLDRRGVKATFFCVGGMGEFFPEVVKKIDARGHEVGCHSYRHTWLNKMTDAEAREDTKRAVDALEQCLGKKVLSYRAPAFSVGGGNLSVFNVLHECGIERDASVFPAVRDFGGFSDYPVSAPSWVNTYSAKLKEFPVCMTKILGREMAYSGGGYFRFFPLGFIKSRMKGSDYNMCYFHIGDLVPSSNRMMSRKDYEDYFKEPGSYANRMKRYFKSNIGKGSAFQKMVSLIEQTDFVSIEQADSMIDWSQAADVKVYALEADKNLLSPLDEVRRVNID